MRAFLLVGITAFGLLQGSTLAWADKAYDRCIGDASTNAAWSECGGAYLTRLDEQLNETWQQVFPELTAGGQALLRTEQRAWNAFKEASCLYYSNEDYGREGQVLQMPACRGQIIEERIRYLETLGAL
jgi:uncharacterized protein YecT (DUF1311 family)